MVRKYSAFFLLLSLLLAGCSEQKTEAPVVAEKPRSKEVQVVVPEAVTKKWKSVKIALHDQQTGEESVYQVDIGGSFQIPGTGLRVTAETFMPAFAVNSERATSASNKPTNPAVQIVVRDGQKEVHRGWVFGLYPDRHKYEDQRYKFVLLDYLPGG